MLRKIAAALVALAMLALWPAAPAAAHGGPLALEVAGDGATGVTVRATYKQDGHPVEDQVLRLVLNASGEGGRRVGPVQLDPAGEGRGFYSSGAVLTPGRWTVVVTSPEPNAAKVEVQVDAKVPQTGLPPQAAPADSAGGDGGGVWRWWVAGAAILLGAVIALVLVTRRRATAAAGKR